MSRKDVLRGMVGGGGGGGGIWRRPIIQMYYYTTQGTRGPAFTQAAVFMQCERAGTFKTLIILVFCGTGR